MAQTENGLEACGTKPDLPATDSLHLSCDCPPEVEACAEDPAIVCRPNTTRLDKIVRLLKTAIEQKDDSRIDLIEEIFLEITYLLKRNDPEALAAIEEFVALKGGQEAASAEDEDGRTSTNKKTENENGNQQAEVPEVIEDQDQETPAIDERLPEVIGEESPTDEIERTKTQKRLQLDEACLRKMREYIRASFCNICKESENQEEAYEENDVLFSEWAYEEQVLAEWECNTCAEQKLDDCVCLEYSPPCMGGPCTNEKFGNSNCADYLSASKRDHCRNEEFDVNICPDYPPPCKRAPCKCCHCRAGVNNCRAVAEINATVEDPVAEMKYFMDSLIFDLEATDQAIRSNNIKPETTTQCTVPPLSARDGYPAEITEVTSLGINSLYVRWRLIDCCQVAGYELYLDGHLTNRLYSPCHDSAIIAEVNISCAHQITLRVQPEDMEYAGDSNAGSGDCGGDCLTATNVGTPKGAARPWLPSIYLYDPAV